LNGRHGKTSKIGQLLLVDPKKGAGGPQLWGADHVSDALFEMADMICNLPSGDINASNITKHVIQQPKLPSHPKPLRLKGTSLAVEGAAQEPDGAVERDPAAF
jgi:hypothetical protein